MDSLLSVKWLSGAGAGLSITRLQLWQGARATWQPPVNAFRCAEAICIYVDLAGVEKALVDLRVEPRRVTVRGSRRPPEPNEKQGRPLQMLALEIDYGPFERELVLPVEVDVGSTSAEQENGLLWIHLPLRK